MKTVAFILSFFILFLAIEPGVSAMFSHEFSKTECCCCKSHCDKPLSQKKDGKKKGCCDESSCNPFALCQCCVGFIVASSQSDILPVNSVCEQTVLIESNLYSQFQTEFWQPPKIS